MDLISILMSHYQVVVNIHLLYFSKIDDNKTGALLLNIGTNYKTSNSFKVVGEVLIKVQKLQIRLKYLEYIFYSSCTNFSA